MFDIEFLKTPFGRLEIYNVYASYEEPTIFSATNEYGQLFFCYWIGVNTEEDRWIINPVSESLINKLEQKKTPISKLIKPKGYSKVFMFSEFMDSGETRFTELATTRRLPFTLPDDSVFISENINLDGSRKHTHRVRINKESQGLYLSNKLADIFGAFSDFYHALRQPLDVSSTLEAVDALRGSFNFRVKATNIDALRDKVYPAFRSASSSDGLNEIIANRKVDLLEVRKIFTLLSEHKTDVELIEESSTDVILKLTSQDVEGLMPILDEQLATYLNSTMVPQADHLDSIQHFLKLLGQNGYVTPESFGKTSRQVSYYRDAVTTLGFMHDYGKLTPKGIRASQLERNEFISLVKEQFEETECGYIWMSVADVDSCTDLNENAAADFLIEYCTGLSENTARRRGATLKRWIEEFKSLNL